ncbi:MAG: helix-hairpin-helix domain-containing protein [Pyrinomonadaceae bacterium]
MSFNALAWRFVWDRASRRFAKMLLGAALATATVASCGGRSSFDSGSVVKSERNNETRLAAPSQTQLDINIAAAAQMEQLPGVGPSLANEIIEHRRRHGPFRRVEHIMMVRGFSERKFKEVQHLIEARPAN